MSSCLSGGRTYGFDLELIKSQTSSSNQTTIQTTSSSSSTLSESSNSPLSISTRKPRTSRKRPNQIYNEAAALLSTAYPNIFSRKHFTQNPGKFTKPRDSSFYNDQSDELLLPFRLIDDFGTPLHCHHHSSIQEKPKFQFEQKMSVEISSPDTNSLSLCNDDNGDNGDIDDDEDLNGESSTILDEEIEEGIIDSIMGNLCVNESVSPSSCHQDISINASYGYPMPIGLAFGGIFGLHRGLRTALKPVDEGDWWRFPAVDVDQISPKYNTTNIIAATTTTTNNNKVTNVVAAKKKKKKIEKTVEENEKSNSNANANVNSNSNSNANSELSEEKGIETNANPGLLLKLNFDDVLTSWSDRGSPFSDDIQASELAGADLHARLAQIDLFLENGGVREASVMRYKEKRRTRLFSKKIRYQVRKVNADTRPRMKGRFVRRQNCNASGAQR